MINSTKSQKTSESFSSPLLDIAKLLSRKKGLLQGRQVFKETPPSETTGKTAKFAPKTSQ
ncbi:MAG: hypothetical protein HZB76_06370 [Chlamydiae bacterium]|nr:hypothetical protein [Chlamydiota bacterium]